MSRHHRSFGWCASTAVLSIIDGGPWTARHIHPNTLRQHCHVLGRTFRAPYPASDPLRLASRRLLQAVASRSDLLLSTHPKNLPLIPVLVRIAAYPHHWIRDPETWSADSTAPPRAQIRSLAEHLFARWAMPACFDSAWFVKGALHWLERDWYCLLGSGGSLRKAQGMPPSLSSRALHLALTGAPADLTIRQALRWGQVRAAAGSEGLMRAVLASAMAGDLSNDAIWSRLIDKVAAARAFDPRGFGLIADTLVEVLARKDGLTRAETLVALPLRELLHHCRNHWRALMTMFLAQFPEHPPGDIRSPGVRTQLRLHHGQRWQPLFRSRPFETTVLDRGEQVRCRMVELLNPWELVAEGREMKHCVATYARDCRLGRCSIFSLRTDASVDGRPVTRSHLTIEVRRDSRRIVQVRGRRDAYHRASAIPVIGQWAQALDLVI